MHHCTWSRISNLGHPSKEISCHTPKSVGGNIRGRNFMSISQPQHNSINIAINLKYITFQNKWYKVCRNIQLFEETQKDILNIIKESLPSEDSVCYILNHHYWFPEITCILKGQHKVGEFIRVLFVENPVFSICKMICCL